MSTVFFHTENEGTAEIRGLERHMGASLIRKIAATTLSEPFGGQIDPVTRHFPAGWQKHLPSDWTYAERITFYLEGVCVTAPAPLQIGEHSIYGLSLMANTALRLGSDAVKLLVRLHMSCEVHTWVDGPNRTWLAGIVERGRKSGVLREDMGWESLVELLRQRADQPVVTSYSVCDSFPNRHAARWEPPPAFEGEPADAWRELSRADRWSLCIAELRRQEAADPEGLWLELRPDNWERYYYGAPLTIMDLNAQEVRERLQKEGKR